MKVFGDRDPNADRSREARPKPLGAGLTDPHPYGSRLVLSR
ncbi:hypothetical protein QTL95_22070 [Rhizobium sp. S152]|nr:hypothetical protein [Rhizobium sp. S152]MDM9628589.1 hypothetical protein [Rhizobium sp. S152]